MTEKMDGTNAQILILEDGTVRAGSRNRWITPESDNFGFAKWVEDNKETLIRVLGPGRHYGEWVGRGIQCGYGLEDRWFYLFDTQYEGTNFEGLNIKTVPILYKGIFSQEAINEKLEMLRTDGSVAVPGFMNPEGVVIYMPQANTGFKITLNHDGIPKSLIQAE